MREQYRRAAGLETLVSLELIGNQNWAGVCLAFSVSKKAQIWGPQTGGESQDMMPRWRALGAVGNICSRNRGANA